MPVCSDCLNRLIEEYRWDENSVKVKRARGLSSYPVRSTDRVVEELDRYLSSFRFFREKSIVVDRFTVDRLMRTTEFLSIPSMREK